MNLGIQSKYNVYAFKHMTIPVSIDIFMYS